MTDKLTENKKEIINKKLLLFLLIITSITDGIAQGILILQEKIAKDSLFASDLEITYIGVIASTTIIFSLLFTFMYSNKNRKWLLVLGYMTGRFIFVFSFFITESTTFLVFLFLYHTIFSIQLPVTNHFFPYFFGKRSGELFGIVRCILMLFMMLASILTGKVLDYDESLYRLILISVAVFSFITYAVFFWIESKVEYSGVDEHYLLTAKKSMRDIFKNTDYMIYQTIFMVYGFAFMICMPTVNLFLINVLNLSNTEMANAKGIYAQLFIMLTMPFVGKLFDRMNVWKTGAISYGILIFYPLFFVLSYYYQSKPFAYIALLFYSLGLSGVTILWHLGATSFCSREDSFVYQGFHQTLTGIRGFFGPLLGYYILSKFGYTMNFYLAFVLFLIAAVWSIGYYKLKISRGK